MIAAESSIAERQERSKRCVKGRHKKAAEYFIDKQTEVLVKDTSQSAVEDGINVQQKAVVRLIIAFSWDKACVCE